MYAEQAAALPPSGRQRTDEGVASPPTWDDFSSPVWAAWLHIITVKQQKHVRVDDVIEWITEIN